MSHRDSSSEVSSASDSSLSVSAADAQLDLRGTPCPLNFVRAKLRLAQMPPGSTLELWLDPGEPIEQVPSGLEMEGYQLSSIQNCETFFSLKVHSTVGVAV